MSLFAENTVIGETIRLARAHEWEAATEALRHEGLKHAVEAGMHALGSTEIGRLALSRLAGPEVDDPRLATSLAGLQLDGPTGIAAGWDKTGKSILAWQAMGARHTTVGGVPLYPQKGNPWPRLWTMDTHNGDHGSAVSRNAYGFYSPGSEIVLRNIAAQRETGAVTIPVIVQVTANKEFYEPANRHMVPHMLAATIRKMAPVADGISLGLTSPNTLGMRDAQDQTEFIYACVASARAATIGSNWRLPLFYKMDGDGGEQRLDSMVEVLLRAEADGAELINSTALATIKRKYGVEDLPGGLAGADPDYQKLALDSVRYVYEAAGGRLAIHGMGGINSAEQNLLMIGAGASATSINTGVRSLGRRAMRQLEAGMIPVLDQTPRIKRLQQIVGSGTYRGAQA